MRTAAAAANVCQLHATTATSSTQLPASASAFQHAVMMDGFPTLQMADAHAFRNECDPTTVITFSFVKAEQV
jgi:hypothetical protein